MLFIAEMETTETKTRIQADILQICVLHIEFYSMKPHHGKDHSFLYTTKLTLVPFDMALAIMA